MFCHQTGLLGLSVGASWPALLDDAAAVVDAEAEEIIDVDAVAD